ncbi:MAG TPA: BamA/TamA family outer membrane protein [Bacteroidota bacterium]
MSRALYIALWILLPAAADAAMPDSLADRDTTAGAAIVEPFPILSYDTDAGFGYGGKVVARNQLGLRESFDLTLFNSSRGERWYRFAFSLPDAELRQGSPYPAAVDVVLDYDKWISNSFFGLGDGSPFSAREFYTKEPLDLSAAVSRGFSSVLVGQAGLRFRAVRNSGFEEVSRLRALPPQTNGSRIDYLSVFLSVRHDTRNSVIDPSKGTVLQGDVERTVGGDLSFTRWGAWLQGYTRLPLADIVAAARLGFVTAIGDSLPVQVLPSVGGGNTVRGVPLDRFLDRAGAVANVELRIPLLWRFRGVLGLDAGRVAGRLAAMSLARWSVNPVVGLRFHMETFVVRLDVGLGAQTTGFYLNFGQLF